MRKPTLLVCLVMSYFNFVDSKSNLLNSPLRVCTPKEQFVLEGKCLRYVNDLMYLTEEYPPTQITVPIAKNMSSACEKITSCFAEIECDEAQRSKEVYERKCEKIEFNNYKMQECIPKFYETVYNKSRHCTVEFDFFSTDLKTRRDAYINGKSCVVSIANERRCDEKALEYLNSSYDKFVDIMSIKPDEKKCSSLHDEMISKQCQPVLLKLGNGVVGSLDKLIKNANETKPAVENRPDVCDELQNCLQKSCFYTQHNQTNANAYKEGCEKLTLVPFSLCKFQVMISPTSTSYKCVIDSLLNPSSTMPRNSFLEDKECMRTMMGGICGAAILENFDRDWEASKTADLF
ncbi:T20D4.11-like domain-containing protein [Caenorhabditis elegans]|uniref:T20D4.11-like domain-containing protein n=1 Tax=Caenorhabditis elegans TaxID=6239 RepID=Q17930_CAEEL|nr:DUF19 domain-containing protein [Caenorhabditis elegans]CCD64277.1 DUF19 domain-containing protein [Caenorhabditis elegans]|eukprot:NP_504991.1 Uncharacterized protein CELE_C12D5.9 [Caenorhabditis elegans]